MSELKTYIGPTPDGTGLADYYLKSEADKVIANQKYKRCLAMAEWCDSENFTATWYHENTERCEWTEKWNERWLELANKCKYKEAK